MNKVLLFAVCAAVSYLIGGINPAIIFSKLIYRKDIRTLGSHNPGFTNFKRVFGSRYAWFVFSLDIFKGILLCLIFCPLFKEYAGSYQLGAAYAGFFGMIGHCFPVWYRFKGGKGFLVGTSVIWFIDWRAGLVALCIMLILLLTVKYMSLSVIVAGISCPVSLIILGADSTAVVLLIVAAVALIIGRHSGNIKRLINGTESKFTLLDKKQAGRTEGEDGKLQ